VGGGAFSVTGNDEASNPITITAFDATSANGGTVSMTTSGPGLGEFTYDPPAGYEGPDTFTYTISDGTTSDGATVSMTVAGMIWFIDNTAAPGGDGRLSSPYSSLADFEAANGAGGADDPEAGEHVFLYESSTAYNGPVTLLNSQRFIGQDATSSLLALTGITPAPSSVSFPTMNSGNATVAEITSSSDGIVLGQNNQVHGLTIGNTTGVGISGVSFGALVVRDVDVTGSGQALGLSSGDINAIFGELSSASGQVGIRLDRVSSGTLSHTAASSLSGNSGAAVGITESSVAFAYDGDISNSGFGIIVSGNSGSTIDFTGTLTLTTANNAAFVATNGGTLTSTGGAGSTIETTIATPLTISAVTIGSSGITFESISATGAQNGIVLSNTGTLGGLTVTGTGLGCGDTAASCTGGAIRSTSGDAILLTNTTGVSLTSMLIKFAGGDGIESSGGGGFTFSDVTIASVAGNGWTASNLTGSNVVDNASLITGVNSSNKSGIRVQNTNTDLTLLSLNDSHFTNSSSGQSHVLFESSGTSDMRLEVASNTFDNLFAQAVTAAAGQSGPSAGTMTTIIGGPTPSDGNTFQNASTLGENNVACVLANGATHNCLIQNNVFDNVTKDGSVANTSVIRTQNSGGTWVGEVRDNVIQNINVALGGRHGIGHVNEPPSGIATTSLIIDGNSIDDLPEREAIFIDFRQFAGNGNVTIANNSIGQNSGGAIGGLQEGIEFRARGNAKTVNVLIDNNTVTANMTTSSTSRGVVSVDAEDNATINLNLTNNTITDLGINREIEVDAEDHPTSELCANITDNALDGGAGVMELDDDGAVNLKLVQVSAAAMSAANGGATVTVVGSPTFGAVASCTLPTHP
jgi:hypothetical protein